MDQFKADQADSSVDDLIDKDITAANEIQIKGTPSLIINDVMLTFLPKDAGKLIELLEAAKVSKEELNKKIDALANQEATTLPAPTVSPATSPAN